MSRSGEAPQPYVSPKGLGEGKPKADMSRSGKTSMHGSKVLEKKNENFVLHFFFVPSRRLSYVFEVNE
jgi:hypothetical protein